MEQINRQNEVHIILGDFDINIMEGNQRISKALSNYTTNWKRSNTYFRFIDRPCLYSKWIF